MFFYEAAKIEIIFYTAMIFNEIFLLLQLYLMQNSYLCTQIYRYCMQNIRNIESLPMLTMGKRRLSTRCSWREICSAATRAQVN